MPMELVHLLKAIEVDAEHRDLGGPAAATAAVLQHLLQPVAQDGAVGEAGEPVMLGEIADARLGRMPFRHVLANGIERADGLAVATRPEFRPDAALASIGADGPPLIGLDKAGQGARMRGGHLVAVRGMHQGLVLRLACGTLRRIDAEHAVELRRPAPALDTGH